MIGPFDPFRLQDYSCSRQRFLGRPIDFPCGRRDNVEKHFETGRATDDTMAHAHCMLDI